METFVGRWHADDGFHTVIATREAKCLRVLVPGYPMVLRKLSLAEGRHVTEIKYPVRKAARKLRRMARNNSGVAVRRFLDKLLAGEAQA